MLHKKNISLLVFTTLITFGHNIFTMDTSPLNDQKTQAKIELLKAKLEAERAKKEFDTEQAKRVAEKTTIEITQLKPQYKIGEGLLQAVKDGVSGTISNTGQYYFKKQIDLWLDGSLTTAELLAELNAREEYLGKQLINIKQTADSYRNFLNESEKIAFNKETKQQLEDIQNERRENNRLYREYVSKKRSQ